MPQTLETQRPLHWLAHCPTYRATPVLTQQLAGRKLFIKDERQRLNMGSFKALGGVYAVASLLGKNGLPPVPGEEPSTSTTFVCASAGNHGLAVARGAQLFGAKARVYLASGVPLYFEQQLQRYGAQVIRAGANYDESVDAALIDAENTGAILLADGSWPGYTDIPLRVMEGYSVIAQELCTDFSTRKQWPSHVFIQAGVGGLAAAISYHIRHHWQQQPAIIIVEPTAAPCLQQSHRQQQWCRAGTGDSIMGRLDCKQASLLAWQMLEEAQVEYCTVSDAQAQKANTQLENMGITTTPSGAAGVAGLLSWPQEAIKQALVFVTEQQ